MADHPDVRDLLSYCRELGWRDPLELPPPAAPGEEAGPSSCASLAELEGLMAGCERCNLARRRKTVVVGEGSVTADVLFIGEGPGAEEDRTGRPFVGPAGKLLDAMIFSLGLERQDVYITNVVKCRPPGNRDPEPEEMAACAAFLDRQIELIGPRLIISLGRPAARRLTGTAKTMGALRGRWASYRGIPVLPVFHPAYLLRQPLEKRTTWNDLKAAAARLREP